MERRIERKRNFNPFTVYTAKTISKDQSLATVVRKDPGSIEGARRSPPFKRNRRMKREENTEGGRGDESVKTGACHNSPSSLLGRRVGG